jgi:hypothetical protein
VTEEERRKMAIETLPLYGLVWPRELVFMVGVLYSLLFGRATSVDWVVGFTGGMVAYKWAQYFLLRTFLWMTED